jgi:hypothetical protein
MAGNTGSPLCAELNRIANYGVYPDRDDFLEEQGAANVWAGTTGQGLLGALNYIVDPNRTDNNYKGLTAVCNELAGTTGLSDVDALRTINHPAEVLLKGTTARSASYYVDAVTPTNWGSLGYIALPGVNSNYLSIPDSAALDITSDIDIRWYGAMDDWTPASASTLIGKWDGALRSFTVRINADGTISFFWSADGTASNSATSTAPTGVTDGTFKWIRATLDVDNGASGKTVTFYTSDNGTSWTQLGTAVTTAGTTSIYASALSVTIGNDNNNANPLAGKVYRAQILNGIGGTTVLDVNIATDYKSSNLDTFTATTGQTVTVNGVGTVANYGTAGSLLPTTVGSSTAADSNDPKFLAHTGTNYVYTPGGAASGGTPGNLLSVPDSTALDITGDIDIRCKIACDDWTPAAAMYILTKYTTGGNLSYVLQVNSNGTFTLTWSTDGTTALSATSTVANTIADGSIKWVRATLDVDNGASGNTATFYLSDDGTSWTQLGSTVVTAGVTSIFAGTSSVALGQRNIYDANAPFIGKYYRAQILNGINGTTVLDVDTSVITTGAATSFTALTGQTVTIYRYTSGRKTVAVTQPTWLFGTDDYMEVNNRYMAHSTAAENYVYLSGASNNYMSVVDNPPLDITGDLDLRVQAALDDWTPAATSGLVAKWLTTGNQRSYRLDLNTSGNLVLFWSTNGTAVNSQTSTAALSLTDGAVKWVRATIDIDNGASGHDIKFFTSDNGTTWTQLGTTIVGAGTTSIYSGTATLDIGAIVGGSPAKGKFYRAQVLNGIDGTVVLDADASVITLPSQTTFVDRSSNAYTVTINKSGVGTFVSTGNYMYLPGIASNYASTPDAAALDITGDLDLRVKVALDDWTPSANNSLIYKWDGAGTSASYGFRVNATTGVLIFLWTENGSTVKTATSTVAPTVTDGSTLWVRATLDIDNGASGNDVKFFTSTDGLSWTQLGSTITTAGVTSIFSGTGVLEVGSFAGGLVPARGKFFRAQVLNGIGGTVAFDANFESSITSLLQTSFTESSTNAATVTINRSGSTFRSAGVIDAGYLYPGATNTFSNSTTDFLNFGATDSLTALVVSRQANYTATQFLLSKSLGLSSSGYLIRNSTGTPANPAGQIYDTTSGTSINGPTKTNLALTASTLVRNTIADNLILYTNSTAGTASTDVTTTSLSTVTSLFIGSTGSIGNYADMELYAAAVFRTALTPKNIADIQNYFNGRD